MTKGKAKKGTAGKGDRSGELQKKTLELQERLKELNCLYDISEIIEKQRFSPQEALGNIVQLLPTAWQYPDITCARISVNGDEFKTQRFKVTEWGMAHDIMVRGEKAGFVEVYYLEERPALVEGPFMREEVKLLQAISQRLGKFVELYQTDEELNKHKQDLKSIMAASSQSTKKQDDATEWPMILDILLKTDPQALFRITRKMMYHLAKNKNESFDMLMGVLCPVDTDAAGKEWCGINMPNPRSDLKSLESFQKGVFELAQQRMEPQEIMDLLVSWLRQNNARPLLMAAHQRTMPLAELTNVLSHFGNIPRQERKLSPEDDISIRVNMIRRFLTERLEYINVAKRFFEVDDFIDLPRQIIGPPQGAGKLGGKTAGVVLAEKILKKMQDREPDLRDIRFARSWYVTSDTMREFIHYNALDDISHIKYMDPTEIRQEQPFLEQVFKNGVFPSEIIQGLREVLRDIRDRPIIVRSSSHLEDSFGAAFSGKYKSLFIANTGTEQERLASLMDAISEVWASTFGPNVVEYRRERGLLDLTEDMGVLIQEVVGNRVGPYFMPAFAGVGFSNNEFRWSPRIRREDGILRLVAGLGTRAVDRVADDYPILVSPNRPELRVNAQVDEVMLYSQRSMDVMNMEKGIIETVAVSEVITKYGDSYPMLSGIVSIYKDGSLIEPRGALLDPTSSELVVTFAGVIGRKTFIRQMKTVLSVLKGNLGTPVDVEFAHDGHNLYILQCRPQSQSSLYERIPVPVNIPDDRKIFTAKRYVTMGHLDGIEYIVYVSPEKYEALERREDMLAVARIVGDLNLRLPRRRFILIGPGRWGSRGDMKLGVPIQYRDINNTAILIEMAKRKGGYLPELSFGTHFFQDLVEANINYLPLYPGEENTIFNESLITLGENHLREFVHNNMHLHDVVHLARVADIADGGTMSVVMDSEANEALAYLVPPDYSAWRMRKVTEIAQELDPALYGVVSMYIIGSVKECTAGPESDIDLLLHFRGTPEQQERLLGWLEDWSVKLAQENRERTGAESQGLLDVHIVTDQDISEKNSWASHIGSLYGAAKEVPLAKKNG